MKKFFLRTIIGLVLMGCTIGGLGRKTENDHSEDSQEPLRVIVEGDYLKNYDYKRSFCMTKNGGEQVKFYMENYSSDYFTYTIKWNDRIVHHGVILGNDSEIIDLKAKHGTYEIRINNGVSGNRINGWLRVVQNE